MNKKTTKAPAKGEEEKRPEALMTAYRERLKTLRYAQEFSARGEIPKAVEKYSHYLGVLATYYKTTEPSLSPKHFDPLKDVTEMLLVSHSYWDLAKAYDRSPKLQKECLRCLQQFIAFTLGFKYQHVNAQMLKKYLRSNKVYNKKAFEQTLNRINVESKSCYVATHAFPNNDFNILSDLRSFKVQILAKNKFGLAFINTYYDLSPKLINFLENRPKLSSIFKSYFSKPLLIVLHRVIKKVL